MKKLVQAIVLMLALSIPALATDYHVAKTGSDSNPGTLLSPFLTIAKCNPVIIHGETCYVHVGTYNEYIGGAYGSTAPHGNSFSDAITYSAYPGDTVTVCAGSFITDSFPSHHAAMYVIINGFIMDASVCSAQYTVSSLWADYVRLTNNEIKNGDRGGVQCNCAHWEIQNNIIHDNGTDTNQDHGIYIAVGGGNNLIEFNDIYFNDHGYGIQINPTEDAMYGLNSGSNVVRFNRVHDNDRVDAAGGGGIVLDQPVMTSNQVYSNVVYNNSNDGIDVVGGANNNLICNNVVTGSTHYGYLANSTSSDNTTCNNIFYNNGTDFSDQATFPNVNQNNLTGINPLFTNAAGFDFSIPLNSPACTFGVNKTGLGISGLNIDINGNARVSSGGWDNGPYNCLSTPATGFMVSQLGVSSSASLTTTITASLFNNPGTGHVLIAQYTFFDNTSVAPTITSALDCNANSMTVESHNSSTAAVFIGQTYILSAASNACKDVTITFSKQFTSASLFLSEYTPPAGVVSLDDGAYAAGTGDVTTPSIPVATAHELVVAIAQSNAGVITAASPFTANDGGTQFGGILQGYALDRSAATASKFTTDGGSSVYRSLGISIKTCVKDHLVFSVQPSGAAIGASIGSPVVDIVDAAGNKCGQATDTVTIAKDGSASWGVLAGTLSHAAVAGSATFTGLTVTGSSGSGSLTASAPGLGTVNSNSIAISGTPTTGAGGLRLRARIRP